jgi:predicted nucleic-acid-binding Zn-ribbon protein
VHGTHPTAQYPTGNNALHNFRHNLSPVEVKRFLKIVAELTENLFIYYCYQTSAACPKCGHPELCQSGAVSLFSSSFDKVTHEISACLQCGYADLLAVLTVERL